MAERFSGDCAFAIVCALSCVGCYEPPRLAENIQPYPPTADMFSAPIIVIGTVTSVATLGRPLRSEPTFVLYLNLARIAVENVLRGEVRTGELSVYFLGLPSPYQGGWNGPPPLVLPRGSRHIFFLKRDHGAIRTAADYLSCTVPVDSGSHVNYKLDPRKTWEENALDILLTPGPGAASRAVMIGGAVASGLVPARCLVDRLKAFAREGDTEGRLVACRVLVASFPEHDECFDGLFPSAAFLLEPWYFERFDRAYRRHRYEEARRGKPAR